VALAPSRPETVEDANAAQEIGVSLMGSLSIWHWLIVILVVVLLFGRNKISDLMGDVAKGVKSFKKGLADEETSPQPLESKASLEEPRKAEPTKVG
jgi:sec-independent protein translocase protein TatA